MFFLNERNCIYCFDGIVLIVSIVINKICSIKIKNIIIIIIIIITILIKEMSRNYSCEKFVNLSMSSFGVFSNECSPFSDMINDIVINKKQQLYIIKKMINIAIGVTYYIFCCRNRDWESTDVMQFSFSFLFFSFFLFFFNNSISSSICKLPICSEIYNCTFRNTNKVSIIITDDLNLI